MPLQTLQRIKIGPPCIQIMEKFALWTLVVLYAILRILFLFSTNLGYQAGEEDNLWNILQVIHGRAIYSDPQTLPFEIFLYPPIAPILQSSLIQILGVKDVYGISIILRSLSLVFNLLTIGLLWKSFKSMDNSLPDISKQWLTLLAFVTLIHLNWIVRVDALSILFALLTATTALQGIKETKGIYHWIGVGILLALTLFTKQDGIQLFILIPLGLWWVKRKKEASVTLLSGMLAGGLGYAMAYATWGRIFHASVFGGINNPTSIHQAIDVITRYFQLFSFLPIIALALAISSLFVSKKPTIQFLSILVLGTFGFACATSIKLGAWVNYFTLFNLLGLFLMGHVIHKMVTPKFIPSLSLIFLLFFIPNHVYHYLTPELQFNYQGLNEKKALSHHIRNLIPETSWVYTRDDVLELYLFDRTIFPNQVFYDGMCTYKHKIEDSLLDEITLVRLENTALDYVEKNLIQLNPNQMEKLKISENYVVWTKEPIQIFTAGSDL